MPIRKLQNAYESGSGLGGLPVSFDLSSGSGINSLLFGQDI